MSESEKLEDRLSSPRYVADRNRGTRRKRRKKRDGVDLGWDQPVAPPKRGRSLWPLALGGFCVAAVLFLVVWLAATGRDRPVVVEEALASPADPALEVARAFLAAGGTDARLAFVRDREVVQGHLGSYPEQARSGVVENLRQMGHKVADGVEVTAFAARFADGSFRMLSVVDEGAGPLVDWDSYARYGSAPWGGLISGVADAAEVRVFVRPGEYFGGRFFDAERWVCFVLETPDFDGSLYAYAPAGGELAARMQSGVMATRDFRQHMTLRVKTEGGGLFEVEELLAVGWVVLE